MSKEEVERRIEVAFAAGDFKPCFCRACESRQNKTYRPIENPESEVLVYCDECADELSDNLIPSDEFHN